MNELKHVAIIMDGNGRWATVRGKQRTEGHKAGAKAAKAIITHAAKVNVPALTLWCFSTENWRRPQLEVTTLMTLLKRFAKQAAAELQQHNVRITFVGRRQALDADLQRVMNDVEAETSNKTGMHLRLAINYSGTQEVVDAANRLVTRGVVITDQNLHAEILGAEPDYDLVIRTGGDWRISDFPVRHAELFVTETLFPDFSVAEFEQIIAAFQTRERRLGGIKTAA